MFLFVFTVVVISLVGLFFQVILALGAFLTAQQIGAGQQMMIWHAMAYEYSCDAGVAVNNTLISGSNPSANTTAADPIRATRFGNYAGYEWRSYIFDGTRNAVAARLVATYVPTNEEPLGLSAGAIAAQMQKLRSRTNMLHSFGTVTAAHTVLFSTFEDGVTVTITYGGIPNVISTGSTIIISDADC